MGGKKAKCYKCGTTDKTEFSTFEQDGATYYQSYCRPCANEYHRNWAKKNAKHVAAYKRKRYEKLRGDPVKWAEELRKRGLRRSSIRLAEQVAKANKRARKYGLKDKLKVSEWKKLIEETPRCPGCRQSWALVGRPILDHIVSMKKRGRNRIDNIQPICDTCHAKKIMSVRRLKSKKRRTNDT